MNWLLSRLKEPSTWRGLVWLLTFAGITLEPAQTEAIITAGIALAGLLGVFTNDSRIEKPPIALVAQSAADSGLHRGEGAAMDHHSADPERCILPVTRVERMQSPVQTPSERVARLAEHNFTSGFNDR